MLYLGSEVMREVAWVVFDEVHYMRDKSRGVVWEETLILLPHTVKHVFLSATIPNALQFAQWVCKVHHQPCHVVYTTYRPTPLQHYLSPSKADGIYLVVDEKGSFRENNFQKAMSYIQGGDSFTDDPKSSDKKGKKGPGKKQTEQANITKIIRMILEKNFQPVIVFSFNRAGCESLAKGLSKLVLNTDIEQKNVMTIFNNAIGSLSEEDRNLDQIQTILPFLKNGVGIHHSGLLPILKETIELLFQEGLVKVLFATETFSIGLNMPAKTVVFTGLTKFDGDGFRLVSSGEYIQMSGRAGRRGLDDRGIVIAMIDAADSLDPAKCKEMIKGQSDPLNSAFTLKYNMILNLTRVDGFSPEFMLQNSFLQFQNTTALPKLLEQLNDIESQASNLVIENEKDIERYYKLKTELASSNEQFRTIVHHHSYSLPFLNEGRLAKVKCEDLDYGWGIIISYKEYKSNEPKPRAKVTAEDVEQKQYVVDMLLYCQKSTTRGKQPLKHDSISQEFVPADINSKDGEFIAVPVMLTALNGISTIRTKLSASLSSDDRASAFKTLKKVHAKYPDGVPHLDPVTSMKIVDENFQKLLDVS
jgi:ATP-dependent RNA helicase DOB1